MTKKKILVVDDEEDILELVRYNLSREGYDVVCASTGEEGLKAAKKVLPDLIVLDLMLPGIDGLEVARLLKADGVMKNIPVIMLTARGEEADIVTGLELGADDYITKPFSPRVMTARVRAALRRKTKEVNENDGIILHDIAVNPGRREVTVEGKQVSLTFTEFGILNFLIRRPGWVFTRSQIVDAVKGDDYFVTDRSVDVQIVGLRRKLGAAGKNIETVRGVGYRLRE